MAIRRNTTKFRALLKRGNFIFMPVAYDPIGGRLVESLGFKATYTGGFVTGGSRCITEPMVTMREQVDVAGDVANAVKIPTLADGGAGFGEPMHTMRSVREFIRAGIAGIHIEDQFYPKRAHYHKYVAHAIPAREFVDKIKMACRQRDETDKDFVIIARSDTARFRGMGEAVKRVNMAADVGADMGLVFPRNHKEALAAPQKSKIPLVYVQSRGNRDGRPLYSEKPDGRDGLRRLHRRHFVSHRQFPFHEKSLTGSAQDGRLHGHDARGVHGRPPGGRGLDRPRGLL